MKRFSMKRFSLMNVVKGMRQEPPLGWSQLSHQKVKLLVALTGVAFADILIFTMLGFLDMFLEGSTFVHRHLNADLVMIGQHTEALYTGKPFSRRRLYQADAVEGVAAANPFYLGGGEWINPWDRKSTEIIFLAFDPNRPVLDLPEVDEQLDQIKLPNVVLLDRKSQPKMGPVTETLAQGNKVTTEVSGHRISVGGQFTLGSSIFTDGHLITSDWNLKRFNGPNSLNDINLGALILEPDADLKPFFSHLKPAYLGMSRCSHPKTLFNLRLTFGLGRLLGGFSTLAPLWD